MRADNFFERKWARVRDHMRREGMAALVLCENGRTRYVSGYQRYYLGTYLPFVHAVVLTLDAGPVLLLPRHIMRFAEECVAEKVVEFPLGQEGKIDTVARILSDLGVAKSRIGLEFDFVQYGFMVPLKERLREAEIVDASPMMSKVTAIKFPEELDLIRESARMVGKGMAAAIEASQEGVTELEVARRSTQAMFAEGAEAMNFVAIRSGPHAWRLSPLNTMRRFEKGDCVQIDVGCMHQGYTSDMNRTAVVGEPTDEQRKLLRVGQAMLEAGIAAVRPGVRASEVWRASFVAAEKAGMADRVTIPFTGHGIGLGLHEEPYIFAGSDTILEENMALALEPGVYAVGIGGSRPEDMLFVTATGHEVLTHYPYDYDMLASR